ncbi:MAG: glycogen/starch synthase, partial [Fibrobacter sp.]|nr:glycogen/starch synthase [Fibrobacter sp.]
MQGTISNFDPDFIVKNDCWVLMRRSFHDLFNQDEIDFINKAESSFDIDKRTIAYLSFENRFASLGGLAAVSRFLPVKLNDSGESVIFITPLHSNRDTKDALEKGILEKCFGDLVFSLCNTKLTVSCYSDTESAIPSYFLQINGRFFAGENPYEYDDPDQLLLDSLSFCAAIPYVLKKLGYTSNLILHANDWETASIAISSKLAIVNKVLKQARTILTLHNSFDRGISAAQKLIFFGGELPGDTILQCSIPFLNGPLTTVSSYFAHELRHDPLQIGIFTDHLQGEFSRNPPIGIENGLFGNYKVPFTKEIMDDAKAGKFDSLIKEKNDRKIECLSRLDLHNDKRVVGKIVLDKPDTPVFFMSGRLDIMQKGFDVIFYAFKKLPPGSAKLIFCPSSGNNDIKFFKQIAQDCNGDIVICPFRVPETDYKMFLKGASYLIMPSFYEPFGAATEGYIHGTPVLARGTGGLWTQVNSIIQNNIPEYYKLLKIKSENYGPSGILYREEYN